MIQAKNIHLAFGEQIVFDNESFTIAPNQRLGLVGRNGSGKSTLLKAIAGKMRLDSGSISHARSLKVAYMPQEVVFSSDKTVLNEAVTAFQDIATLQEQAHVLEKRLEQQPDNPEAIEHYAQVSQDLAELHPDRAQAQAERILAGLGFDDELQRKPVSALSIGWKMRLILVKLLLQDADFYLFDEPTNHLDIVAKDWFLNFLRSSSFGFALVCHERFFLDQVCSQILELEYGSATLFQGGYSAYERQKEELSTQKENAYEQQQKEIRQKQATINRFRAQASKAKMVQSMIKSLEKTERITLPPQPKNISVQLQEPPRSGRIVLNADSLGHAFGEKQLFESVHFKIERGHKIALIAPNGVGKTTLFSLIAGKLEKQMGTIEYGYSVHPALFAQDQTQALDTQKTVFANCVQSCSGVSEQRIRALLGAFLFDQDDIEKKVGVLSGGEKNRVGMICTLLQGANFLLLDEPTNNLDIPSKEILLKALKQFTGTIFFVSHDHDFVNELATHIIELTPHGTHCYHGDYSAYCHQKKEYRNGQPEQKDSSKTKSTSKISGKQLFALKKEANKLERSIEKREKNIEHLEQKFAQLTYGTRDFDTAQQQLSQAQTQLDQELHRWEQIQKQL